MSIRKVTRYFQLYGFGRTIIKVAGRSRKLYLRFFFPKLFLRKDKNISLIGCGQFGFSTISYFLLKKQGNCFLECYDPIDKNLETTASFWGYAAHTDAYAIIANPSCKYVYIASNHASHTDYAIEALKQGKIVYVEKPISVNYEQFKRLLLQQRTGKAQLYVGYNRPFSAAIACLAPYIKDSLLPLTINCFVVGHYIEKEHWYRKPEEGTRICGNVGHWIDLSIYLLHVRGKIANEYSIAISYSNNTEIDDNISIAITTEVNDLITIIISSRAEPFEGINESIQFQSGDVIAKINDFRSMEIWNGEKKAKHSFRPKDVGHSRAINQPFDTQRRDFSEIEISTVIMLEITDMVRKLERIRTINTLAILKQVLAQV